MYGIKTWRKEFVFLKSDLCNIELNVSNIYVHGRWINVPNLCAPRKEDPMEETSLTIQSLFDSKERNKGTFVAACDIFMKRGPHRRGHVEFIYSALKLMESYGVHKDLEVIILTSYSSRNWLLNLWYWRCKYSHSEVTAMTRIWCLLCDACVDM